MSSGAYLLVHFANQEKLMPAAQKLAGIKSIEGWDAVDGHVNLVIRSNDLANTQSSLKGLDGLDQLISCCIQKGQCEKVATDPSLCYAYVFIEAEKGKIDSVKKALEKIDQVVFCSQTDGGCDLVGVVKGQNFSEVDRIIEDKVRVLDSVLRLKHNRIIDLKQL